MVTRDAFQDFAPNTLNYLGQSGRRWTKGIGLFSGQICLVVYVVADYDYMRLGRPG